jgi:hypothetical protein
MRQKKAKGAARPIVAGHLEKVSSRILVELVMLKTKQTKAAAG